MKCISRHIGKLEIIERIGSSANGNPRFLIRIGQTTCKTAPDSMLAYGLRNFEGREVEATIGIHRGSATLNSVKIAETKE